MTNQHTTLGKEVDAIPHDHEWEDPHQILTGKPAIHPEAAGNPNPIMEHESRGGTIGFALAFVP
ncbi:MAG: hypothetical protein Q7R81_02590 [Candidatus Peregrinibacteria bacterium]|nr:hypothetical protein [Candidatus Peregrinibacteria bacterium]